MKANRLTQKSREKRKETFRDLRSRVLIVCEGSKTEPNYFKSFRTMPSLTVKDYEVVIHGLGQNTDSLVEAAIKIKNEVEGTDDEFNRVWCVFDRDSFPSVRFNRAFDLVESENKRLEKEKIKTRIELAYTNEAFELWYLLHFEYRNTAMSRKEYNKKLTGYISALTNNSKFKYGKNLRDIYNILLEKQPDAIRNARKLLKEYNPHNPEKDNPCTRVHILVEELNKLMKR